MRARATISFILRTLDLTVLRANGKKMGCALFFALDCMFCGQSSGWEGRHPDREVGAVRLSGTVERF